MKNGMTKARFIQEYLASHYHNTISGAEIRWDELTLAGYGDEPEMVIEIKEPTIHLTKKDVDKMIASAIKLSPVSKAETQKCGHSWEVDFVDDGLHLGKSVKHWRWTLSEDLGVIKHMLRPNILVESSTLDTWFKTALKSYKAYCSAIAFRDGDIEGYRAMHGGV